MDQQSPVTDARTGLTLINYASMVLPSKEYGTMLLNFPGNNCIPAWAPKGNFSAALEFFSKGKHAATMHLPIVNENGFLEADLDEVFNFSEDEQSGLVIIRYWTAPKIPIELYFSHMHRSTGTYILYPAAMYMGDLLYLTAHIDQLENSLFWPGSFGTKNSKLFFILLNPYPVSFSSQISLFLPSGKRIQSEVMKVQPQSTRWIDVEDLFKEQIKELGDNKNQCSLCITSQHKALAYGVVKDRETDTISSIDHLHQFTMI